MSNSKVVCVTGGSGVIGSWLVRFLLERGYTVHATVQNLDDEKETEHLKALEQASINLRLFQIDLLDYATLQAAINGTHGVFHLASPCIVDSVHDPEKQLLDPAIKGTTNVLKAAKECGVKRVVVTSSISAITPSPNWPSDVPKREDCWTDVEYCKQKKLWYPISKTLAEKTAWEFAKENDLDVVVINPGTVMGPIIPPAVNASMLMLIRLIEGCTEEYENFYMGPVHVKDVALAHILLYENTSASGRHLCVEAIRHFGDLAAKVAELYPEYKIPRIPKDTQPGLLRVEDGSKKLMDLGFKFTSMEQMIKDAVESLKSKAYVEGVASDAATRAKLIRSLRRALRGGVGGRASSGRGGRGSFRDWRGTRSGLSYPRGTHKSGGNVNCLPYGSWITTMVAAVLTFCYLL